MSEGKEQEKPGGGGGEKEGNEKEKVEKRNKREEKEGTFEKEREIWKRKRGNREAEGRVGRPGTRCTRLPAAVWVGGGRHDKVKVKLASYLIRKASVLHFSLSFCQVVAVAFLVL